MMTMMKCSFKRCPPAADCNTFWKDTFWFVWDNARPRSLSTGSFCLFGSIVKIIRVIVIGANTSRYAFKLKFTSTQVCMNRAAVGTQCRSPPTWFLTRIMQVMPELLARGILLYGRLWLVCHRHSCPESAQPVHNCPRWRHTKLILSRIATQAPNISAAVTCHFGPPCCGQACS